MAYKKIGYLTKMNSRPFNDYHFLFCYDEKIFDPSTLDPDLNLRICIPSHTFSPPHVATSKRILTDHLLADDEGLMKIANEFLEIADKIMPLKSMYNPLVQFCLTFHSWEDVRGIYLPSDFLSAIGKWNASVDVAVALDNSFTLATNL